MRGAQTIADLNAYATVREYETALRSESPALAKRIREANPNQAAQFDQIDAAQVVNL